MNPVKNPDIFSVQVSKGIMLIVNSLVHKGMQLVSKIQITILNHCDGKTSIAEIAFKTNTTFEQVKSLLTGFEKKDYVLFSGNFKQPVLHDPKELGIWLHTTSDCTLRCTYCHVDKKKEHLEPETIYALTKKLIQTVQQKNLKQVKLNIAGGEPMMRFHKFRPALIEMKHELFEVNCKLSMGFTTNLTILTDDVIKFIKEHKCNIAVSMDGLEEYHDKNRMFANGKGSFQVIERNLHKLTSSDISPMIIIVVADENLEGLPEFTKYLVKHNLKFRYSFIRYTHCSDMKKLLRVMFECYDILEKVVRQGYHFANKHNLGNLKHFSPGILSCGVGRNYFSLFTNGEMHICHSIHDKQIPFGNVFDYEEDIFTLLENQTVLKGIHYNDCKECQYRYICSAGCPMDRVDGRSPYCEVYKILIPRVYQLIGLERLIRYRKNKQQSMANATLKG